MQWYSEPHLSGGGGHKRKRSKTALQELCDRLGIDDNQIAHVPHGKPIKRSPAPQVDPKKLHNSIWLMVGLTFCAFVLTVLADVASQQGLNRTCLILHLVASVVLFSAIPLTHLCSALGFEGYSAFMPGKGGIFFVSYQAVGWALYAMAIVMSLWTLVSTIKGVVETAIGLVTLWGALALISQILITSSIFTFVHSETSACPTDIVEERIRRGSKESVPSSSKHSSNEDTADKLHIVRSKSFEVSGADLLNWGIDLKPFMKEESLPVFFGMNIVLVLCGIALASYCARRYADYPYFALYGGAASACFFIVAIFNTYGVGGYTLYNRGSLTKWEFFQPGKGGWRFVTLQFLSWLTFSASLVLQLGAIFLTYAFGLQMFLGVVGLAGVMCLVAELLMVLSLSFYRGTSESIDASYAYKRLHAAIEDMHGLILVTAIANVMYLPFVALWVPFFILVPESEVFPCWVASSLSIAFFVFSFAASMRFMSRDAVNMRVQNVKKGGSDDWHWGHFLFINVAMDLPLILALHWFLARYGCVVIDKLNDWCWQSKALLHALMVVQHVYIVYTYGGNPAETGVRRAPNETLDEMRFLFDHLRKYFSCKIIRTAPLDPDSSYMFGYHPHGVAPLTVLWLTLTSPWKTLFPEITVNPCSASVLHCIPLLRDVLHFFGVREVTRRAITSCFKEGQSVMLVPGGQKEMVYTSSAPKRIDLYTKHTGFIRMALQHGASLVPVFTFGETETLSNIRMQKSQMWFINRFGVPAPHYMYGRWLLPIPRPVDLTVVVGEPLQLNIVGEPTPEEIQQVYVKYYGAIQDLFERYKREAGYADWELVLH